MTRVLTPEPGRQLAIMNDAFAALMGAMDEISERYNLSGLSAATLCLQASILTVRELGGTSSKPYMGLMLQGAFCTDEREGDKLSKRAERYMNAMAVYFDARRSSMGPVQ